MWLASLALAAVLASPSSPPATGTATLSLPLVPVVTVWEPVPVPAVPAPIVAPPPSISTALSPGNVTSPPLWPSCDCLASLRSLLLPGSVGGE